MPTIEETLILCAGGPSKNEYEPLHGSEPDDLARVHTDAERGFVFIEGCDDGTDYSEDLLIVVHEDGWALFWRDPEDALEYGWGRTWCGGTVHQDWRSLVREAYSL